MARILTGIQSTGTPHLGNILGAIRPAVQMAADPANESFLFIADMHSLTQIKNGEELRANTYSVAATWLAFGLDTNKVTLPPERCASNGRTLVVFKLLFPLSAPHACPFIQRQNGLSARRECRSFHLSYADGSRHLALRC